MPTFFYIASDICGVDVSEVRVFVKLFGEQVKAKRKSLGITQAQLSADANIEISQISRIERGVSNTTVGTVFIIASAMNIHIKELFSDL